MTPTWDNVMRFPMPANPVIFDVGGHRGTWTAQTLARYPGCSVHVFEAVPEFNAEIRAKFAGTPGVSILGFGLSGTSGKVQFFASGDSSSTIKGWAERSGSPRTIEVDVMDVVAFMRERQIGQVDLMKVNIEGAEYDLLDRLASHPEILGVRNLLVQFHTNVDGHDARREAIRARLRRSHSQTFNYDYVFEGWTRNEKDSLPDMLCVGDSHVSIFSGQEDILMPGKSCKNGSLEAMSIGPALAYNLPDKQADLALPLSKVTPGRSLLFCLGEIDCRAQVGRRLGTEGPEPVIGEIVRRYMEGLKLVRARIPADCRMYTFSVTPELREQPHWYYYGKNREAFDAPHGTLAERTAYKDEFNRLVRDGGARMGIKHVSIYEWLIGHGSAMEAFYMDDIHLNPAKVKDMVKKALLDAT